MDKLLGPNGIYPRLLHEATKLIAGALAEIFYFLLNTSEFPDELSKKDSKEGKAYLI